MKILHLCWGLETTNGAANIARLIMGEQRAAGYTVELKSAYTEAEIAACDELWCHCGWYWRIWLAVRLAKKHGKAVRWIPECCYDPVRRAFHGWKKMLVSPFERWALRRADVLVATCSAEAEWIRAYEPQVKTVEVADIRRFFRFDLDGVRANLKAMKSRPAGTPLKVLYLGRLHPLKGAGHLVRAVGEINNSTVNLQAQPLIDLHLVSGESGAALEDEWTWCDLMCLPTLSDNFGLVVAEALVRGKPVITTDGAPAWEGQQGVVYLKGYREGNSALRVKLLRDALQGMIG